jgi:ABC-type branched-subunit amino acid transport system substrate-binding protein
MHIQNIRHAIFAAAALALLPFGAASAQETFKVGASLGLTGYGSLTDGHWRDGLEVAIAAVNAQGGVLGHKLELVYEDNKSTPQQAVVVYRKMMSEDNVKAFDSGCISAGNFAAAGFVSQAKLPMFLCSILPRLPDEQKWAFSFLPPPKFEVEARYDYLKNKTDVRKIGILADPSPYSLLMKGLAEKEAADYGLTVVANETYQQDDADFSVQVGRINAAGGGAVIMIGQGNAVVTAANNIKHLGLDKLLLLGSINEKDIQSSAGNVLGAQFLFPAPMIQVAEHKLEMITNPVSRAAAQAFVAPFITKNPETDTAMASRAWDSVLMMVAAIKKAGSTDGTALRDAFETLGHYDGAGASYDFSADQHVGITKNPYIIASVIDDKMTIRK